jgi:phosphonate transport system substrate-binding protein
VRRSLVALLAALALACGPARPFVDLSQLEPVAIQVPQQNPVRIAVASVVTPARAFETYRQLMDYLARKLGRPVEMVQRASYAETNELVRTGRVDLAMVCSGAYVEGERDFGLMLVAAPQVRGEIVYYSLVIARKDSSFVTLQDLRGRSFAFTDPLSNTGYLVPTYYLARSGTSPAEFFGRFVFTYSHDNSVRAVAEGWVDAAAVDSLVYRAMVEADPSLASRLKVVERYGPYGIPPVVASPKADPATVAAIRDLLLHMADDAEGSSVLDKLGIDRFVSVEPSLYDEVRSMAREVRWRR